VRQLYSVLIDGVEWFWGLTRSFVGRFEEGKSCRFAFGFTPAFGRAVARFARGFYGPTEVGPFRDAVVWSGEVVGRSRGSD
jgi:hypothetical protein